MKDMLVDRDLWHVITDPRPMTVDLKLKDSGKTETESLSSSTAEWDKSDRKARSLIRLCLADSVLVNVATEPTAKDLWTKLESLYQSKSLVNKLFLRKKLYNLRMKDGDNFSNHLHEFNTIIGQMLSIGVDVKEDDKAITLLSSLPDSWDNLIVAIGSGTTTLCFENVVAALLSEEMRRLSMGGSSKDALFVRGRTTERKQKGFGDRSKSRGRSKSRDKVKGNCWNCGKPGHLRRDCKSKAVNPERQTNEGSSSGKNKNDDNDVGDLYFASCLAQSDRDIWIIDTGASFHMTPHRDWFCDYE
ncbi:zf-CCHC domain-containing protein/UBN2_2 domain-containing protein, partial [Cephalotus follicularis]